MSDENAPDSTPEAPAAAATETPAAPAAAATPAPTYVTPEQFKSWQDEYHTKIGEQLKPFVGQYEQLSAMQKRVLEALGGQAAKPEPKFISEEQYHRDLQAMRQEQVHAQINARMDYEYDRFANANPDAAAFPGFREAVFARAGKDTRPIDQIAADVSKDYDAAIEKRNARYAAEKDKAAGIIGGSGRGAPSPGGGKSKKAESIDDMVARHMGVTGEA